MLMEMTLLSKTEIKSLQNEMNLQNKTRYQ